MAVLTLALAVLTRPGRLIWLGLVIAALVVAAQALWLLPLLDARALLIIEGQTPRRRPGTRLYIVLEVAKLLALLTAGWLAVVRPRIT